MVVVFIDMLGVRARWHRGGREEAEAAFSKLHQLVEYAIREVSVTTILTGGVETDSAAIVFESTQEALNFARALYTHVFRSATRPGHLRVWLRGSILKFDAAEPLRLESSSPTNKAIKIFRLNGDLLDAIAIEKSGIKGMRLIIDQSLITESIKHEFAFSVGAHRFYPFRRLDNSIYPGRVQEGFSDFLWMANSVPAERERLQALMSSRLRWSASDPEEVVQAAATQVVFNEVEAIMSSLSSRTHRR